MPSSRPTKPEFFEVITFTWSVNLRSAAINAHRFNVPVPFWRLSNDGVVDIADFPAFGMDQPDDMAQRTRLSALELRVGVECLPISPSAAPQQCIAERVQQHVGIRPRVQIYRQYARRPGL